MIPATVAEERSKFTLEGNVIPDTAFISSISFIDFDTNDVPRHWLDWSRRAF